MEEDRGSSYSTYIISLIRRDLKAIITLWNYILSPRRHISNIKYDAFTISSDFCSLMVKFQANAGEITVLVEGRSLTTSEETFMISEAI